MYRCPLVVAVVLFFMASGLAACGDGDGGAGSSRDSGVADTGIDPSADGGSLIDADGPLDSSSLLDAEPPGSDAAPNDGALPSDGAPPTDDAGLDGGSSDAGMQCLPGEHACGGTCIPDDRVCGVAIGDACMEASECGTAGECIDERCVCAEGYRACALGCCPVNHATASLAGVEGEEVQLEFGADGTAYILVKTNVATSSTSEYELHLYTRPPSGAIARAALTIPVSHDVEAYDFAVRSDGTLFAAVAPDTGEGVDVQLHEWRAGMTASTSEVIGGGFGWNIGIGLALDDEQTVWVTWSTRRAGGLSAYSRAMDGLERSYMLSTTGNVQQSDVEYDPRGDAVHSFWANRYGGGLRSGAVLLSGMTALTAPCPADDAAFDSMGRHWTVYRSYPGPYLTSFCVDGMSVLAERAITRDRLPSALENPRIVVDGDDTAFIVTYETDAYAAHWLASTDGARWSRGELPIRYGLPDGVTDPAPAYTAAARAPDGQPWFVVLPSDATMGDLTLVGLTR